MFKVMTWNVENLFRPHTEFGPTSDPVYEAELGGLAGTINALPLSDVTGAKGPES